MRYTYKRGQLDSKDVEWFEERYPGYFCTGETLEESYRGEGFTYAVMSGRNTTPYGMCRDCGNHYIIARWDRYDRIDKATLKRTADVEDR